MIKTKYTDVQPLADFDWDMYSNGYNGSNLVKNKRVKTNNKDKVYCHEKYAQELYNRIVGNFTDESCTPKDQINGALYNVRNITKLSSHEVVLDTYGGMSAVVDMNKEHDFIKHLGCKSVDQFMVSLNNPDNKKIILNQAKTAKVVGNRVSIMDGVRANVEQGFMEQLNSGTTTFGYSAKILCVNNGGYTVDIDGVHCFLPGSLAASGPITDFEALIGKTVDVCVVNYSKLTNNFVVSHKKYLELTLPNRVKNEIVPGLKISVKVTGQSKNGLFCAIRDNNGDYPFASLMHRSTMSPDMESSFDKGEFVIGDVFIAYVHRVDWDDNYKYRIVIGDKPPVEKNENENE